METKSLQKTVFRRWMRARELMIEKWCGFKMGKTHLMNRVFAKTIQCNSNKIFQITNSTKHQLTLKSFLCYTVKQLKSSQTLNPKNNLFSSADKKIKPIKHPHQIMQQSSLTRLNPERLGHKGTIIQWRKATEKKASSFKAFRNIKQDN